MRSRRSSLLALPSRSPARVPSCGDITAKFQPEKRPNSTTSRQSRANPELPTRSISATITHSDAADDARPVCLDGLFWIVVHQIQRELIDARLGEFAQALSVLFHPTEQTESVDDFVGHKLSV